MRIERELKIVVVEKVRGRNGLIAEEEAASETVALWDWEGHDAEAAFGAHDMLVGLVADMRANGDWKWG